MLLGDTSKETPEQPLREQGFGRIRSALLRTALRAPRLLEAGIEVAERTLVERSKLLFVFEGRRDEVQVDAEAAANLALAEGGESLGEGPARAWFERRYAVSYKQSPVFRAGVWNDTLEVAAPWSKLEALFRNVRRALSRHALVMAHMSHAYPDGCSIYFTFVGRSRGAHPEVEHAAVWRDALEATLASGGVVSHHHGVGRLRKEALARELGPGGSEAHGALKRAWDPDGIMNPGSPFEPGARSVEPQEPADDAAIVVNALSGLVRLRGNVRLDDAERALGERWPDARLGPNAEHGRERMDRFRHARAPQSLAQSRGATTRRTRRRALERCAPDPASGTPPCHRARSCRAARRRGRAASRASNEHGCEQSLETPHAPARSISAPNETPRRRTPRPEPSTQSSASSSGAQAPSPG